MLLLTLALSTFSFLVFRSACTSSNSSRYSTISSWPAKAAHRRGVLPSWLAKIQCAYKVYYKKYILNIMPFPACITCSTAKIHADVSLKQFLILSLNTAYWRLHPKWNENNIVPECLSARLLILQCVFSVGRVGLWLPSCFRNAICHTLRMEFVTL